MYRPRTLVMVIADLHTLVYRARHQAGPCIHSIVDRIGGYVGVSLIEPDAQYHEIVDMVQLLADKCFSYVWIDPTYHYVP